MKSVLRLSAFALASAAALFATGCSKKPQRPNPGMTMLGPGPDGLNGGAVDFRKDKDLLDRDPYANQDRATLQHLTVYFDVDSAGVRQGERSKLTEAANYLKNNPGARLLLEGHCDWRGTSEYNLGLGDRRAASVKTFITNLGASSGLETVSKGDIDAKEGVTAAEMQKDRRVDLVLLK